jgi:hypothetical protein
MIYRSKGVLIGGSLVWLMKIPSKSFTLLRRYGYIQDVQIGRGSGRIGCTLALPKSTQRAGFHSIDGCNFIFYYLLLLNANRLPQDLQEDQSCPYNEPSHSLSICPEGNLYSELFVNLPWFSKEDRTATVLLNGGQSSLSYTSHINPHFRLPKSKKWSLFDN